MITRTILSLLVLSLFTVPIEAMTRQVALQRAQEAQTWLMNNKGKIIALGATIAAILGSSYLAAKSQPRLKVIDVYQKYNIQVPAFNDPDPVKQDAQREARTMLFRLGLLAYEKKLDGLQQMVRTPNENAMFKGLLLQYPTLAAALAELADVSLQEIKRL